MTDEIIIGLFTARSETAIAETQRLYGRYFYSIAHGIVWNDSDAEEVVNDTYLHAWNTIPPQKPFSLKDYLGRLVRHLSIDRYRAMRRAKRNIRMTEALDELTVEDRPFAVKNMGQILWKNGAPKEDDDF